MNAIESVCKTQGKYIISSGTLRPQDILNRLLDTLQVINPEGYEQTVNPGTGFSIVPDFALEDETNEWWDSEEALELVDILSDALNEAAPEGFHFAVSDEDSSCFGFWKFDGEETVWN